MTEIPDTETLKNFNKNIVDEFRANDGKVTGEFANADLLLLTTTVNPAWVHNLRARPQAHVEVGAESFDVIARELPSGEREALFPKLTAAAPGFAEYQSKTSRVIPLFELQPA